MPNALKTTQQWVDYIAQKELPAITSTAHLLDKFSSDDKSSLPKLSEAILYDQGLSSCVLKVANSLPHISVSKVSTVSRATVVLGIQSVKNICLTSKLLEGLLRSKNLSPGVFTHVSQLMASSFHAGLLAKMMLKGYSDDTQEQVYLASMLYRIGETAFWSFSGDLGERLLRSLNKPSVNIEQEIQQQTGTSFSKLTLGLASTWNLSDLLIKSLDEPQSRTVEMQIIYLSDKLSQFISKPPHDIEQLNDVLTAIADIMQVSSKQLKKLIEQTKVDAINLLNSYGANSLVKHIHSLPTLHQLQQSAVSHNMAFESTEKRRLNAIQQLLMLLGKSKNFNDFIHETVSNLAQILSIDSAHFFMLANTKSQVDCRLSINHFGDEINRTASINLNDNNNVFASSLHSKTFLFIDDTSSSQWKNQLPNDVLQFVKNRPFCLAPVQVKNRNFGLIVVLADPKSNTILPEDVDFTQLLTNQLTLCLTNIIL